MGSGRGRSSRVPDGGTGCERRRRRRSGGVISHAHWGDVSEGGSSGFDSYDGSTSTSDDGFGNTKRKRLLDDALFDFFSKQGIKSLKRNFSRLCSESDLWREIKRPKVHGVGRDAFSVYSAKYFFEVLDRLTAEQKAIIEKFGFGCLLCLSKTHMPSSFIRWLALCVDPACSEIIVGDKIIPFLKDAFHFVLGLPNSGSPLVKNSAGGLKFIMSLFNLSVPPHITFFGNKLRSKEPLSDKEVFVCVMQIAVSCFLCPSICDSLDTNYIEQLGDPERARSFDICMLVHKHLMQGVLKTVNYIKSKGRKPKAFEFCSYGLAVYYLDCLDFGAHIAGSGVPRAVSWRGDMIKIYSELDRKGKKGFGRRQMRKELADCYSHGAPEPNKCCAHCGSHNEFLSAHHKETMHKNFGSVLSGKAIDGIFNIVQNFNSSVVGNSNKVEVLVQSVLQLMSGIAPSNDVGNHVQKDAVHASFACLSVSKNIPPVYNEATPVSAASKIVDKNSIITAPELHPIAKVKARLTVKPPDGLQHAMCQSDLISPIGRINLSPSANLKDDTNIGAAPTVSTLFGNYANGSKQAPIPVGDTTPKARLFNIVDPPPVSNLFGNSAKGSQQVPILVGDTTPKIRLGEESPGVTITGTSSFRERQNKLALDTDAIYNQSVHAKMPAATHFARNLVSSSTKVPDVVTIEDDNKAAGARANVSSTTSRLIILQPKVELALPLPHNDRFPVSDDDIMHYCAIVDIAYIEGIQKDYAIKYHGVHCNFVSLGQTLMTKGHIDNFLIPCFCRKLFEDNHPSKSGRHYFFAYVGENILKYDGSSDLGVVRTSFIGAASASKKKRLELSDRLFFPICHDDHWFTFVVDFQWGLFVFIDSYYGADSDYQTAVRGPLITNFVMLWKRIFPGDETDFGSFQEFYANVPRQGNGHDCGIITMLAMEFFDPPIDLRSKFSISDIPHIRIQYANRLFFHKSNKVDRSRVTNFYDKEAFMRRLR